MKVSSGAKHVHGSHGITESAGFNIRAGAHAFKMLSSGLYSDKIGAVLREVGCNAYDAHVQTGRAHLPIEVKLPNRIDNQFWIRDWGPGLSHEDVMNLYTTYFASTKQDSNDFTGAFGLGSKSPFSYVDSFAVVSVHGGKKRTYSAHLSDLEIPTIALLTTEDADPDWDSGMSVGFPIKTGDYVEFQTKAQQIFRHFKVLPRIEGAAAIQAPTSKYDHALFSILEGDAGVHVVMGNVRYPLDVHDLGSANTNLGRMLFEFGGVNLRVNIGDVQVAASREQMQFDKKTVAFLAKRCEEVTQHIAEVTGDLVRKFEKADWAGKCAMDRTLNAWGSRYINWESLFTRAGMPAMALLYTQMNSHTVTLPPTLGEGAHVRVFTAYRGKLKHQIVTKGQFKAKYGHNDGRLELLPETKIFYGAAKHAMHRVREAFTSENLKQVVMITPALGDKSEKMAVDVANALSKQLFGLPSARIDSLPAPAIVKAIAIRRKKGATLPALPSNVMVSLYDANNDAGPVALDKAPPVFMCRQHTGSWNQRAVRVYRTKAEDDTTMDVKTWNVLWFTFTQLQDELKLKTAQSYAFLSATDIRKYDIVKRGWKLGFDVMKEWVESTTTRDAVAAAAAKWRPTVENSGYGTHRWVRALVQIKHNNPKMFADDLMPALSKSPLKLDKAISELKLGAEGNNEDKVPKAIELYSHLSNHFSCPAIAMAGTRNYTTPDELEAKMVAQHTILTKFSPDTLAAVAQGEPQAFPAFANLLFTT